MPPNPKQRFDLLPPLPGGGGGAADAAGDGPGTELQRPPWEVPANDTPSEPLRPPPLSFPLMGRTARMHQKGRDLKARPQKRLGRRLEEVAKAVGGGYCRLPTPLQLAPGVRGRVAGHRLSGLEGGRGDPPLCKASLPHRLQPLPLFAGQHAEAVHPEGFPGGSVPGGAVRCDPQRHHAAGLGPRAVFGVFGGHVLRRRGPLRGAFQGPLPPHVFVRGPASAAPPPSSPRGGAKQGCL